MGDKGQVKDQAKEKKKKKSSVKISDLPFLPKIIPDDLLENDDADDVPEQVPVEVPVEAPAPKVKRVSRKKSTAPAEPGTPLEDGGVAPENGVPVSNDVETPVEGESRKTSLVVPPEAQNGVDEHVEMNGDVEPTGVDDHHESAETPKRRESETAQKKKNRERDFLKELDEDKLTELKELFELLDLNSDGFIDFGDLKLTFATLGREDIPDDELKSMLAEASNPMDFDAFVMLLGFKTIALDPEETLRQALSSWEYRDTGLIQEERIKHDLMTWGDKFNHAEAEGAFEDAPTFITEGQRMIDYIKFCKTLGGLRKKN